jgi:hypothetical protein
MQAPRGRGYSFCLSLISSLDWVNGQRHDSAAFYPGKGPLVLIGQEAGWVSEQVWTQSLEEKSFVSARDRTPIVQSVVRHYTDSST